MSARVLRPLKPPPASTPQQNLVVLFHARQIDFTLTDKSLVPVNMNRININRETVRNVFLFKEHTVGELHGIGKFEKS